jgi:hypothetical protein
MKKKEGKAKFKEGFDHGYEPHNTTNLEVLGLAFLASILVWVAWEIIRVAF